MTRAEYGSRKWELLWGRFWPFLKERGIHPTRGERRCVEEAFRKAYKEQRKSLQRGEEKVWGDDTWLMRGYTFSPTIVFVDLEGRPWPIGGKESFRALFETFCPEEIHFSKKRESK